MAVRRDLVKGAALLAILVAWDLVVPEREWMARWIGPDGFPWRRHWLTETVLHDGARLVALLAMAALMVNVIRPLWPGPDLRDRLLGLRGSAVGLVGVPALKRLSTTSCPWDLQGFGGKVPWVSHWSFGVWDGGPGHCFPSGHAAAGFAFLAVGWMFSASRPGTAATASATALATGLLLGATQVVRGAHFPSHVGWTAWLCWASCALVFHLGGRKTAGAAALIDIPARRPRD